MPAWNSSDPTCGLYGGTSDANNMNCCADTCLMDGEPRCQWDSGDCRDRVGGRAGCCPTNIAKNAPVCGVNGAMAPCNLPGELPRAGQKFVGVDVYRCVICESEPAYVAIGCCHRSIGASFSRQHSSSRLEICLLYTSPSPRD